MLESIWGQTTARSYVPSLSMANYRIDRKQRGVTWSNNVIEGDGRLVFKGDFEFAMDTIGEPIRDFMSIRRRRPGQVTDLFRVAMNATIAKPVTVRGLRSGSERRDYQYQSPPLNRGTKSSMKAPVAPS